MDLLTVFQVLRRRWMIFLSALVLTGVTAGLLSTVDNATYGADGSVIMVRGPGAAAMAGDEDVGDIALRQTAIILAEVLSDASGIEGLPASPANFAVDVDAELPLLRITATGADAANTLATIQSVVGAIEPRLAELDGGGQVIASSDLAVRPLLSPTEPVAELQPDGTTLFTSTATVMLGRTEESAGAVTGIIDPSDSLPFVASVLNERFSDDAIREELRGAGGTASIELTLPEDSPLLHVATTSSNREDAVETGQLAIRRLQDLADSIQATDGVPESLRFRVEVLSYPLYAEVLDSGTLRTVLAVIALGLLASVGLALMVDAAATRRTATAEYGTGGGQRPLAEPHRRWSRSNGRRAPSSEAGPGEADDPGVDSSERTTANAREPEPDATTSGRGRAGR